MRRLLFLTTLILCLVASPHLFADGGDTHYTDARSLYTAGHWVEADEAFEEAYERAEEGTRDRAAAALEWATLLWEQGEYAGAKKLAEEAIEIARDLDLDEATGELLSTLGHIEASMGNLQEAEGTLDACISLTAEIGDEVHRSLCRLNRRKVRDLQGKDPGPESQFRSDVNALRNAESALSTGVSLTKTAELYRDNGDYDQADEFLAQAASVYRDVQNVPALARNRLRRAQLEHHRGNFDEARQLTSGLIERFEKMRNRPMIVHTLALKAEDAIHRGNPSEGVNKYRRALSIAEEIDNPQLIARVHLALCEMNFADSPGHCQQATEVFEQSGMTILEIRARTALARTHQVRENFEKAREIFRVAIDQLRNTVDTSDGPFLLSRTLQFANLCQVEAQLRNADGYDACKTALDGIEQLDEEVRDRYEDLRAATVSAAGRVAAEGDDGYRAVEHFGEAAELYEELGEQNHRKLAADITLRMGALQYKLSPGQDDAMESFRRGLKLTDGLDLEDDEVAEIHISLKTQLAQAYLHGNEHQRAVERLEPLTETAEQVGDDETAAWAYSGLANSYLQLDRRDDALEALRTGLPLAEEAGDEDLVETFETNLEKLEGE